MTDPIDRLLSDREAADMLSLSRPTFRRRVKEGLIPKPLKLGYLSSWCQSEIAAHIEAAKKARSGPSV